MSFVVMDPDPLKRVEMAIEDIRAGKMVILVDDEDRENEGDLTMAAEAVTPEAINFMATHGRGLICLTLTEERVDQLSLPMMATHNKEPQKKISSRVCPLVCMPSASSSRSRLSRRYCTS